MEKTIRTDSRPAHTHLGLLLVKQGWGLGQEVIADLVHNFLSAQAATAASSLGHGVEDG